MTIHMAGRVYIIIRIVNSGLYMVMGKTQEHVIGVSTAKIRDTNAGLNVWRGGEDRVSSVLVRVSRVRLSKTS